jgi:hypothetical protein
MFQLIRFSFTAWFIFALTSAASAQPKAESAKGVPGVFMVFFTPSDVEPPDHASRQLGLVAEYSEEFFARELDRWKYPASRKSIFERNDDDTVKVLFAKGADTAASGKYDMPGFQQSVIADVMKQHQIPANRNYWWIWTYLGPPPLRLKEYRGEGSAAGGGWAVCNFDASIAAIDPRQPMAARVNEQFTLKGCLHEFGHALGLPHMAPHRRDNAGNELMGPRTVLFHREFPREDRVYLCEASAAILWKHPVFTGSSRERSPKVNLSLKDFRATFERSRNAWTVTGSVDSDVEAHTVLVMDETEAHAKEGGRLRKSYADRVKPDGHFTVKIDEPTGTNGKLKLLFCLTNGNVAANGVMNDTNPDVAIEKPYEFLGNTYRLK